VLSYRSKDLAQYIGLTILDQHRSNIGLLLRTPKDYRIGNCTASDCTAEDCIKESPKSICKNRPTVEREAERSIVCEAKFRRPTSRGLGTDRSYAQTWRKFALTHLMVRGKYSHY